MAPHDRRVTREPLALGEGEGDRQAGAVPAAPAALPCPICSDLPVVRYDAGQLPRVAPFCSACRRRVPAVEIDDADRRRLAASCVLAPNLQPHDEANHG